MWLKSKNLNEVRLINLCYNEIRLQVVFRIWFYIPALHWAGNVFCDWVDYIQSGINLQYIPTPHAPPPPPHPLNRNTSLRMVNIIISSPSYAAVPNNIEEKYYCLPPYISHSLEVIMTIIIVIILMTAEDQSPP